MARSAATIQTEIDTLRAQMAKGILRVRHGETDITYASMGEMATAIDRLLAELNSVQTYPVRQVRFQTSKGLD